MRGNCRAQIRACSWEINGSKRSRQTGQSDHVRGVVQARRSAIFPMQASTIPSPVSGILFGSCGQFASLICAFSPASSAPGGRASGNRVNAPRHRPPATTRLPDRPAPVINATRSLALTQVLCKLSAPHRLAQSIKLDWPTSGNVETPCDTSRFPLCINAKSKATSTLPPKQGLLSRAALRKQPRAHPAPDRS